MKVKCILCERTDELDDKQFKAKRLRNRPTSLYICEECEHNITAKTLARKNSGKFHIQKPYSKPIRQLKKELEEKNEETH